MTVTVEDTRYAATMAWIEQVVADRPVLVATTHEYFTMAGQLWVRVEGSSWEANAWHAAVGGLIRPSTVDSHGVRRQMIFGTKVHVEVVDDPAKRDQTGAINVGIAFIVGCVGLFLWGFTHSSRTPNGAWVAAVAIVGAIVLILATGITTHRRREREAAAATEATVKRLKQDTSGAHYLDGA